MPIKKRLNRALDATTMYRVVEYALSALAGYAILLSFFKILPYNGFFLILSLVLLVFVCYGTNQIFSFFTKIPAHAESAIITGLILFFLFLPIGTASDAIFLALAGIVAMASKYIFAFRGRQIFNPAAFSAVALGFFGNGAMWWIGSPAMLPAVIVITACIIKKMRRLNFFLITVCASFIPVVVLGIKIPMGIMDASLQHLLSWPIIFFTAVMITEPLTLPPTKKLQWVYGAGIGILSSIPFHIGPFFSSPEFALIIGNIFSYTVSMKQRLFLRLQEKKYIAKDTCEFIFQSDRAVSFSPGQYMEWTLPHEDSDVRGIRRYFTIASSPTEKTISIGIKFYTPSSSFKKKLRLFECGDVMRATQLCGNFTLSNNTEEKLAFIAGGIGITPFRSMLKYLIDTKKTRDIILFYANKTPEDIAYKALLNEAVASLGIRIIYIVDSVGDLSEWNGEVGFLSSQLIEKYTKDVCDRVWYISGPNVMARAHRKILADMGVKRKNIKTDYFPGFA